MICITRFTNSNTYSLIPSHRHIRRSFKARRLNSVFIFGARGSSLALGLFFLVQINQAELREHRLILAQLLHALALVIILSVSEEKML